MMKIDLHCHSLLSLDNHLEPAVLVEQAIAEGLDGVCFTEHHSVDASAPVEDLALPAGFVVLRAAEVSTAQGHLLIYGPKDDSWNRWGRDSTLDLHEVIDEVHRLGGLCVPAHPFRGWESVGPAVAQIAELDGLETHNGADGLKACRRASEIARRRGLFSIGGSDCHMREQVGRALTLLEREVATIDELLVELRGGRCRGAWPTPG